MEYIKRNYPAEFRADSESGLPSDRIFGVGNDHEIM